jgi:iron complex outermembrane receptor protein
MRQLMVYFALLCFLSTSTVVFAQDDQAAPSLEEIFVTAQKRVETQQEVSAAFSVFNELSLEKTGWSDIRDMVNIIPSMEVIGTTKSRTSIYIRGIGTNKYDIGTEGSIGVFLDGVYLPRFSSVMQNLVDIERVEILRGPQGTLYGRNTIGGAISVYTTEPSETFTGKVITGVANEDSFDASVVLSGPVVPDKLLGYVALTTREEGGFRKDAITGDEDDFAYTSVRTKLRFLASDELTLDLIADFTDEEADAFLGEPIFDPNDASLFALSPLISAVEIAEYKARESADMFENEQTLPGSTDIKANQFAFITKREGEDLTADITLAYRDEEADELADTDRYPYDVYVQDAEQESQTTSLEFKLSSEYGGAYSMDDKLEWLGGFFLYEDDAKRTDAVTYGADSFFSGLNYLSDPTNLVPNTVIPFCVLLAPDVPCIPGGLFGLAPYPTSTTVDLQTSSWAVFGQVTYALTEELSLTLGLRHSQDTKEFDYISVAPFTPGFIAQNFDFDDEIDFESTDPKVVMEWTPALENEMMFYLSYQQGYKSGGIQFITADETLARQSFDKETLKATEAGVKSRWLDQRVQVNASVYHYDYADQQIDGLFDGVLVTSNAGESVMGGFELDLMFQASSNLLLQASYSYLKAEFEDYVEASTNTDFSGRTLPASPENSIWLSAEYTHEAYQGWEGSARLDFSWQDDQTFTPNGTLVQESYEIVNVGYTLTSPDEMWMVRIYCGNCTDQEYFTSSIPLSSTLHEVASTGDLRRYGVSMTYRFGE